MDGRPAATEATVRLELLIGHLSDQLAPARRLVGELQLRANASHATREQLRHLSDITGSIWEHLGAILEEASQMRQQKQ